MAEGVIGNLWVRVKADLKDFKESMSGLGKAVPSADGPKQYSEETEESFRAAGMGVDDFGAKLSQVGMQSAGMGKYSRMMGQAFKQISPALKKVGADINTMGLEFNKARSKGLGFSASLKAMTAGTNTLSKSMKGLAVSVAIALAPLIAIMVIIQAAMWLWNRHKEAQERARKETEATNLATRSLGLTMDTAREAVKKYGNEWSSLAQQMLAWGHTAEMSAEMATQVSELAKKIKEGGLGTGDVQEESKRLAQTLSEGIDGLRKYGIYMTEAELKAYALEKGIIKAGESMNYAKTQAAMLSAITAQLTGGQHVGIPITESLKETAKAAMEAKKSIGLMSFDVLNTIKKQDDAASENPLADMFADLAYSADMSPLGEVTAQAEKLGVVIAGIDFSSVQRGFDNIKNWSGWGTIADSGTWAWGKIQDAGKGAFNWITKSAAPWLGEKWQGIKDSAANAWTKIEGIAGDAWSDIKKTATDIWNGAGGIVGMITDSFSTAIDTIGGLFSGLWDGVRSSFKNVTDTIGGVFGGVKDTIGNAGSRIKSFFGLAGGGAALPGRPGLVTVGDNLKEPEIVAPQSYITQAVADALSMVGSGGQQTITVNLVMDGVTIAKQIVRPLTQEQRRLGL